MQRYVLSSALPVRGVAIGAVGDLLGAVLFVIGVNRGLAWLITIGIVIFVLCSALLAAALLVRLRLRTTVVLDASAIRIHRAGRSAEATWGQINSVSADRHTIYLGLDPGPNDPEQQTLKIDSPRGEQDPQFVALSGQLAERLDQDRGYRSI